MSRSGIVDRRGSRVGGGWMARDEFSASVRMILAQRAGYLCSKPGCGRLTIGPSSAGGVTITGEAAHITGASPGGPRHDPGLSPTQRTSADNGIWLCATDATLIDK